MLGRCPRSSLNRTTSRAELRLHGHEISRLPPGPEKPLLQPPHQIVIGFDLASDSSKSSHPSPAACESPRSVLEPHHVCFRAHHQAVRSPRSPLSALGSLLSGNPPQNPCAEGAALCVKAAIKAEVAVAAIESQHTLAKQGLVEGDADGVDAYPAFSEREHVAADFCKTNKQGDSFKFSRTNCAEARKNQPCMHGPSNHASRGCRTECLNPSTELSSDDEDEDNDEADVGANSGDVVDILPASIFSTASPVASHFWSEVLEMDFLSRCYLCRRRLLLGKDVFMYRGDRAFCSKECRHKQIVVDERKERRVVGGTCVSGASSHHQSFQRANQAAVA